MCKKCIFLVDALYCFKDQCETAEIKLKKRLSSSGAIKAEIANASSYNNRNYEYMVKGKSC